MLEWFNTFLLLLIVKGKCYRINPSLVECGCIRCRIVRGGQWVSVEFALQHEVYVAPVSKIPHLGRFIMRYDGLTLGIGRITELKPSKFHKM